MVEAGLLSRFQAAPREGHLEQMFHIMAYLNNHNKSWLVFDHSYPNIDNLNDSNVDWLAYYPGAAEPIPPNLLNPVEKKFPWHVCWVSTDSSLPHGSGDVC